MQDTSQLKEALVDVRKAYRLLYQYHRRMFDMVRMADEILSGYRFETFDSADTMLGNLRASRSIFASDARGFERGANPLPAVGRGGVGVLMLHAVAHRKHRGRLELPDDGEYTGNEDLLTSSVFGLLSYLSEGTLRHVLSTLEPAPTGKPSSLLAINFWPRYPRIDRPSQVEPDAVLHFDGWLMCVEAKRSDEEGKQTAEQLNDQRLVMASEHPSLSVQHLAIGGVRKPGEPIDGIAPGMDNLTVTTWGALSRAVEACAVPLAHGADWRILRDVVAALKIHGVYPMPVLSLDSMTPEHLGDTRLDAWDNSGWQSLEACGLGHSAESGWLNLS